MGVSSPGQLIRQQRSEASRTQGDQKGGSGWKRLGARSSRSPDRDMEIRGDPRDNGRRARNSRSPLKASARSGDHDDACWRIETRAPTKPEPERGFCQSAVGSFSKQSLVELEFNSRGRVEEDHELKMGRRQPTHRMEGRELVKNNLKGPRVAAGDDRSQSTAGDAGWMQSDSAEEEGRADGFESGILASVIGSTVSVDDGDKPRSSKGPELLHNCQSNLKSTNHCSKKDGEETRLRVESDPDSRRAPSKSQKLEYTAGQNAEKSSAIGSGSSDQAVHVQKLSTDLCTIDGTDLQSADEIGFHASSRLRASSAQGCEVLETARHESKNVVLNPVKKVHSDVQPSVHGATIDMVGVGMVLEPEDPGDKGLCYVSEVKAGGPLYRSGKVQVMDRLWAVDEFRCFGSTRSEIRNHVMGR
jgi:hypothetical protein